MGIQSTMGMQLEGSELGTVFVHLVVIFGIKTTISLPTPLPLGNNTGHTDQHACQLLLADLRSCRSHVSH